MRYKMNAEKIEVSIEIDDSFVEAVLGLIRAIECPDSGVEEVYRPVPPEPEAPSSTSTSEEPVEEPVTDEPEIDRTSVEYNEWVHYVLMWLQNFDQEGEQPDRGEKTRTLGMNRYSGKVLKLVHALGGITQAVKDVGELAYQANESARIADLGPDERDALYRLVAENMAQVSSIFFADLSDLLEYHNPLED